MNTADRKSSLLNVHAFVRVSYANGPGARAVVWTQGCSLRCPGCSNPLTHSHKPRILAELQQLADAIAAIPSIQGLTVTGGEPFEQAEAVGHLCQAIRTAGLSVMVFTGWTYESIRQSGDRAVRHLLEQIDVLVDGPFVRRLVCKDLLWRGSSNQQVRFLTDRYSPDVLRQEKQLHVEGQLDLETPLQLVGFPLESDIKVLAECLAGQSGVVLEPVGHECNQGTILGGKDHDCVEKDC